LNFSPLDVAVQFTVVSGYRCLFPTHVVSYQSDARRRKGEGQMQGTGVLLSATRAQKEFGQ